MQVAPRHDEENAAAAYRPCITSTSTTSTATSRQRRPFGEMTNVPGAAAGRAPRAGECDTYSVAVESKTESFVAPSAASTSSRSVAFVPAIDIAERHNPQACTEYVPEIFQNYRRAEVVRAVSSRYMVSQTDISEKMRGILIDWLNEVAQKYKLEPETLFLTINIIDRYLEKKTILRQKLQLVGVGAMLIASKYEEIYAPEIRDFVYITDSAYTAQEILQMESSILSALGFRLSVPTIFTFLSRFTRLTGAHEHPEFGLCSRYIAERSLQEYSLLKYLPSEVAAASTHISMRMVLGRGWEESMSAGTGYTESALRPCINDMLSILRGSATTSLQAVRRKYSSPKFSNVARFAVPADI